MKVDGAEVVCWYGLLSVHVLGINLYGHIRVDRYMNHTALLRVKI
jgi:hypothetical protein